MKKILMMFALLALVGCAQRATTPQATSVSDPPTITNQNAIDRHFNTVCVHGGLYLVYDEGYGGGVTAVLQPNTYGMIVSC